MQGPIADHDTGRMGRGVGVEPLEGPRNEQEFCDLLVALGCFLQARLALDGLGERHGIGRVLRHELGQLVDLPQRHFQNPADVTQHATRQEGAERDDLRDPVASIAVAYVGDDLVPARLAEVDVEIGHRHAFGIEKALEQQAEAHRIQVGDGQRIGDERSRTRPAAWPDRDVLGLGPFDEVRDDQEIAGELHIRDDVELELQPLRIVLFVKARCRAVRREPQNEARGSLVAQRPLRVERRAIVRGIERQDGLAGLRPIGATARDLDRVGGRLGQIREKLQHLGPGAEPMLG